MTPCIKQCKLKDDICAGCRRSLQQIKEWSTYSMSERMDIMNKLKKDKSYCPECGNENKCAIENGKSASTCWCMTEPVVARNVFIDSCLCRTCLNKE